MIDQPGEPARDLRVALAGRRPLHVEGGTPGRPDRLAERWQADVEDLQLFLEPSRHGSDHQVPSPAAIRAAMRTACALLSASITPAAHAAPPPGGGILRVRGGAADRADRHAIARPPAAARALSIAATSSAAGSGARHSRATSNGITRDLRVRRLLRRRSQRSVWSIIGCGRPPPR